MRSIFISVLIAALLGWLMAGVTLAIPFAIAGLVIGAAHRAFGSSPELEHQRDRRRHRRSNGLDEPATKWAATPGDPEFHQEGGRDLSDVTRDWIDDH